MQLFNYFFHFLLISYFTQLFIFNLQQFIMTRNYSQIIHLTLQDLKEKLAKKKKTNNI